MIITDLGKAFTGSVFWDFCQDNLIDIYYSLVAHPWCNGQVERAKGMVLQALKDRIYDDASNYATRWLAELPHVIWGLRTQVSSATGFSPFFLVYGSEAILPTDITFGAPRIQFYEEGEAEQTHHIDFDSLEEQRLTDVMRQARHDQQLRRYHDRNIKETSFNVGDLVLRRIQKTDGMHKLSAPWEGPFIVMEVISPSTYRLQWSDGQGVPNPWTWSIYDDSIRSLVSFQAMYFPLLYFSFFRLNKKYFKQSYATSRALPPPSSYYKPHPSTCSGAWLKPTSGSQDLGVLSPLYPFPSTCSGAWLKSQPKGRPT
jgi:hypothetical protein